MKQSTISASRKTLMGLAVLWIALIHAQMWFRFLPLQALKRTGQSGVDIFLFLSSFGLYYAWQKGPRDFSFLKRRLVRIYPTFFFVALFRILYQHMNLKEGIYLVTTLPFWLTTNRSMWYVSAIIVLYLFSYSYLQYFKDGKEISMTFLFMTITLICSVLLHRSDRAVFYSRLPIFILGFLAGKYSYEEKEWSKKEQKYFLLSFLFGVMLFLISFYFDKEERLLWGWGMYWYPSIFLTWPLCLYSSYFFSKLKEKKRTFLIRFLDAFGEVSLEFYLIHELCIQIFSPYLKFPFPYEYNGILPNLIIIAITYVIAKAYHQVIQLGMKALTKKWT